jgi:hypothetical protein
VISILPYGQVYLIQSYVKSLSMVSPVWSTNRTVKMTSIVIHLFIIIQYNIIYIYHIHTLMAKIKFICTSFINRKKKMKSEPLARLLAYFAVNANKFYIYLQCIHIVFILQCQNVQTTAKLSEKKHCSNISNGVLYHVCTYTVTVSYHHTT